MSKDQEIEMLKDKLARVEAERDELARCISTAAECVRLTSSLLAMHANTAQSEQQEAQGAQAEAETVLDMLKTAYESGYQDGQDAPNAYSDEKVKDRIALSLLEEMMVDAAIRAQNDEKN